MRSILLACLFLLPVTLLAEEATVDVSASEMRELLKKSTVSDQPRFKVLGEIIQSLNGPNSRVQLSKGDYNLLTGKPSAASRSENIHGFVVSTDDTVNLEQFRDAARELPAEVWIENTPRVDRNYIYVQPREYYSPTRYRLSEIARPSCQHYRSSTEHVLPKIVETCPPKVVTEQEIVHQPIEIRKKTIVQRQKVIVEEPYVTHETEYVDCDPIRVKKDPCELETRAVPPLPPPCEHPESLPSGRVIPGPTYYPTETVIEAFPMFRTIVADFPGLYERATKAAVELGAWGHESPNFENRYYVHLSHREFKTVEAALGACYERWFPNLPLNAEVTPDVLKSDGLKIYKRLGPMHARCFASGSDFGRLSEYPYFPIHYIAYAEALDYYNLQESIRATVADLVIP